MRFVNSYYFSDSPYQSVYLFFSLLLSFSISLSLPRYLSLSFLSLFFFLSLPLYLYISFSLLFILTHSLYIYKYNIHTHTHYCLRLLFSAVNSSVSPSEKCQTVKSNEFSPLTIEEHHLTQQIKLKIK